MPRYPKHPSARANRSKASSATELVPLDPEAIVIPDLPVLNVEVWDEQKGEKVKVVGEWHPQAQQTWVELWSSPCVSEWTLADLGAIRNVLLLEHQLWTKAENGEGIATATEALTRLRKELGATPMGRRSLQWVIAQTADLASRYAARHSLPEGEPVYDATCVIEAEDVLGALA